MTEHSNMPGPGERFDPEYLQAEAQIGPIPDGEMRGFDPRQDRRRTLHEMAAVEPREAGFAADFREHPYASRAGTDPEAIPVVRFRSSSFEQRLDHSAATQDREQALDSVCDDAGPQSD